MSIDRILAKMAANPDRGTPCRHCGSTAKDCQMGFLVDDHRCCKVCDNLGGSEMHSRTNQPKEKQ